MRMVLPVSIILIALAIFAFLFVAGAPTPQVVPTVATSTQPASISVVTIPATTTENVATTTLRAVPASTTIKIAKKPTIKPQNKPTPPPEATTSQAIRAEAPYSTPPESFESIQVATRAALVNILCMPQGGTMRPISGSGVIIDPRGVILTNAHVAQYVLLSENPQINLTCSIRSGSPASARWKATVLYIPAVWVNAHYKDLNSEHVSGTGEHDYAFLRIVSDADGNSLNSPLPYLPVETRDNVAFEGDQVLVAGYPAEFVGGIVAQQGLYANISPSTIKQLLTFDTGTIDVLSVGGVIEAQGGSSGGPVVNAWRHVVAIISTTSEGATTAQRDLHTLNLNYIDRDLVAQTGASLASILQGDIVSETDVFTRNTAAGLIQKYIDFLTH